MNRTQIRSAPHGVYSMERRGVEGYPSVFSRDEVFVCTHRPPDSWVSLRTPRLEDPSVSGQVRRSRIIQHGASGEGGEPGEPRATKPRGFRPFAVTRAEQTPLWTRCSRWSRSECIRTKKLGRTERGGRMDSLADSISHLGVVVGGLAGGVGVVFQGPESGVLWSLVGYFLGKSVQSMVWAVAGNRSS